MQKRRCGWARKEPDITYHDLEWGVPEYRDDKLFEFIVLEFFQAGLSWSTILNKRENFRKAFDNFDYQKIANYPEAKKSSLLADKGIIRNKRKIEAAIQNARAFITIQEQYGSFKDYIWSFVNGVPIRNAWHSQAEIPASTKLSDRISKEMKRKGFTFWGSTICYAFMQAIGMVNDHEVACFRHHEVIDHTPGF